MPAEAGHPLVVAYVFSDDDRTLLQMRKAGALLEFGLEELGRLAVAYDRTADQLPFRVMTPVGEPRSSLQIEVPLMELPLIVPV